MHRVVLRSGKEKPVLARHPWIFSGAIARIDDGAADGDLVDVVDGRGRFLARGYLNRRSQIAVRVLTWNETEVPAWAVVGTVVVQVTVQALGCPGQLPERNEFGGRDGRFVPRFRGAPCARPSEPVRAGW